MPAPVAPNELVALDELEITIIVDNETDTLSSVDEGIPQTPEVLAVVGHRPVTRECNGHPGKIVFDDLCCACHGLSALVVARAGTREHRVLFDVGPYGGVWLENARRLRIDLAAIDCVFLSHWHFDHSGGFPDVIRAISAARRSAGLTPPVVDVHPRRPDQRGILHPSGTMLLLPFEPTIDALRDAGGLIRADAAPHLIGNGLLFGGGEIDRVTPYETGLPGHHSFYGDRCEADAAILDERLLAASVRGRGITLLSACSHAGIVNACLYAQRHIPGAPIDLLLGGFHLAGKATEARIEPTIRDLREQVRPRIVAPGHCTGWRAKARLAAAFAPGAFAPSVVGSRYRLQAG